jgi:thiosulfate/3-mercaptopyruvate sulfurtransferase
MVSKQDVLAAMDDGATCIVNALSAAQHRGEVSTYARRGHIPGALNVPAAELVDADTGRYLPLDELRERFADVLRRPRVVTYCGGGIAATSDAFALTLLGHEDVAVYDGSLTEWAADPALPLVTDD